MLYQLINKLMNIKKYFVFTFLVLILVVNIKIASAAGPSLSLSPTTLSVGNSQNFTVTILVDTATSAIDGVDILSLHYNPAVLQIVDDDVNQAGVQITAGTLLPITVINSADNTAGTVKFSQASSGGSHFTGSGTLATIHFRSIAGGTSPVTFDFTAGSTVDTNMAFQGVDLLSSVTNASFTVDTTAPTVSITAPTVGANVSGSSVTVSANASDNIGVVGVQFKLDGANLGAEDTASPYSVVWNASGATNGSHTLTAIARDAVGNTTTSSSVSVTVSNPDVTPPTVSITSPAPGSSISGTVTVSANASDNIGVAGVQFKLDGINLGAEDTTSPYSVSWNSTSASNASHTLTAVARDAANNSATGASVSVTVNNNQVPLGNLDEINDAGLIRGWSFDPDSTSSINQVKIYIDGPAGTGTLVSTQLANVDRPDIRATYGITGNHGFEFPVPAAYQDNASHTVYVYGIDSSNSAVTTLLTSSGKSFTTRLITLDPEAFSTKIISGKIAVLDSNKVLLKNVSFTTNSLGQFVLTLDLPSQIVYLKTVVVPFLSRLLGNINLSGVGSQVVFPKLSIGDLNQDNIINSLDYSLLNSKWFTSDVSTDLNKDGIVNSIDFSYMNLHWLIPGEQ
jgi:hypothetical protein